MRKIINNKSNRKKGENDNKEKTLLCLILYVDAEIMKSAPLARRRIGSQAAIGKRIALILTLCSTKSPTSVFNAAPKLNQRHHGNCNVAL